ncbi:hypothetical protein [Psychromicrobium sp. YIM B11713]|uniref:hypothetical protein n=1 Tax=Psychromicrobium sp. YIM B11713 TaxID=3145233 RepID=UPI00374EA42B
MVANIGIKVEGARELRASLKEAAGDLEDLKALHKKIAAEALPFALFSTPNETGALVSTGRSSGTATAAYIRFGNLRTPYAGAIHWGTPAGFHSRIGKLWDVKPQPWLVNAVHDSEPFWAPQYFEGINKILKIIHGK